MDPNMQMAHKIAQAVAAQGGRAYYVGGLVRDRLMGRENKDVDIEVHGVPPQALEAILDGLGQRTEMGASFGVYGLRHYDIDIALPRKEEATGRGHKDFAIFADPFLGTKKAAIRRDFTINAMMEDVLTGEIIDHFGGQEDLKKGVIRHVNDQTFTEDPLRVLRGAQFAARFGFTVAPETCALCRGIDLSYLAAERIFSELEKALMKADTPSVFFEFLRKTHQLSHWFPEIEALIDTPQEPRHHPEGDVWNHTMLVLDQAAHLRSQARQPLFFMLSALCHDLGKPVTTALDRGVIRSIGHEKAGIPLADRFLSRITNEIRLHKYVLNMVELHMYPNQRVKQKSGQKSMNHLFDASLCPEDLLLLAKADHTGRPLDRDYTPTENRLREQLQIFHEIMARPYVMGADLIAAGMQPGPDFGEALAYAHKLRLAGVEKESALLQTMGYLKSLRVAAKKAENRM